MDNAPITVFLLGTKSVPNVDIVDRKFAHAKLANNKTEQI